MDIVQFKFMTGLSLEYDAILIAHNSFIDACDNITVVIGNNVTKAKRTSSTLPTQRMS